MCKNIKTIDEFRDVVSTNAKVMVCFYAHWYNQHKELLEFDLSADRYAKLMRDFPHVVIHKVNVSENPETAESQDVHDKVLPVVKIYCNGRVANTIERNTAQYLDPQAGSSSQISEIRKVILRYH